MEEARSNALRQNDDDAEKDDRRPDER